MPKRKPKGFAAEFKQFIAESNVMDMAVGVIVGGAFKAIADSLTADIIMPIVGIFVSQNSLCRPADNHRQRRRYIRQFYSGRSQLPHHGPGGVLSSKPSILAPQRKRLRPRRPRPAGALQ